MFLQEDGDSLLLEDTFFLLLEDGQTTPPSPSSSAAFSPMIDEIIAIRQSNELLIMQPAADRIITID